MSAPVKAPESVTTNPTPAPAPTPATVKEGLPRRRTEDSEYGAFATRIVRAFGRRVAHGEAETLLLCLSLSRELDKAMSDGVAGLRSQGYSWAEIGSRVGTSRQAAQQRWGKS